MGLLGVLSLCGACLQDNAAAQTAPVEPKEISLASRTFECVNNTRYRCARVPNSIDFEAILAAGIRGSTGFHSRNAVLFQVYQKGLPSGVNLIEFLSVSRSWTAVPRVEPDAGTEIWARGLGFTDELEQASLSALNHAQLLLSYGVAQHEAAWRDTLGCTLTMRDETARGDRIVPWTKKARLVRSEDGVLKACQLRTNASSLVQLENASRRQVTQWRDLEMGPAIASVRDVL